MQRRTFLKSAIAATLSSPFAAFKAGAADAPAPPTPKNILFIMADDLNRAISCFGHPAASTPNLNRLAARGLLFSHTFCTYPLCGPSRSALFTGRRPESFPMPDNEVCWRDLHPELKTLPEIARAIGYHTERIGKIGHQGVSKTNPADWRAEHFPVPHTHTDPLSWVREWGDSPYAYEVNAKGPEQVIDGQAHGGNSLHTMRVTNSEVLPDTLAGDRATAFLGSPQASEKPFFLAVGFNKPHLPQFAPEKWWAFYDSLDVEPLWSPTAKKPCPNLPAGVLGEGKSRFHRGTTEEQRCHLYKGYLACVSHMDEQVGRVLDALDAAQLTDSTLVVFVPDHGFHLGEQGHWGKMTLLDPSLRIPMIMAGPGIPRNSTCPALVESIDLFPTLCTLMGWKTDQKTHGTDITPWIKDPQKTSDRPAFAWVKTKQREGWTLRTATHRYGLVTVQDKPVEPFLFDIAKDPHETTNLAGNKNVAEIQAGLHARLKAQYPKLA